MAQIQKLGVEAEVKCSADKFYGTFKHNITQLPKFFPQVYKSIELIQGDGASVGSVRLWKYEIEGTCIMAKDRTTMVDDKQRAITWSIIDGELLNHYNSFELKLVSVTPKGDDGCLVKWSLEFEKANEDAPTPTAYMPVLEKVTKELAFHL
ncbi:Bet v I domain [Macleaya cordata]|uniref:Bet v I domain n=1 Tax=Macleaya cordata TaxID=56857 RepID=A0A200PU44_MACCD|nr:Bet v I domain [Macleaya cordata]